MRSRPDRDAQLLSAALAVATLCACTFLLRNQPPLPSLPPVPPSRVGESFAVVRTPTAVEDWDRVRGAGHRSGPDDAPVTIVEFSDFQCAECRVFETDVVPALRRQFPNKVAFVFRHDPSPRHHDAYAAARAAECAAREGRFAELQAVLFSRQAAIGHTPLAVFARASGVTDLRAFDRCIADTAPAAIIDSDMAEARRIGAIDAPTIVVNGIRFPGTPDMRVLSPMIRAAIERAK